MIDAYSRARGPGRHVSAAATKLLLVGATADALEAKRVVLERAGYVVGVLTKGASVRKLTEEMGAALVIIDTSTDGPDVRAALAEMTGEARPGEAPSTTPVLVIGPDDALREFDGPGAALAKPAEKRALLESARTLVAGYREGAKRKWSRRSRA